MNRLSKDSQDLRSEQSSNFYNSGIQDQYAKSFQVGSNKRFVNVTLPNIQIKGKQFYKKQPYCTICFRNFTTTFRQHHCRICVNAVCGDCSRSLINKQRACDVCVMRFTNTIEEKKKKQMLQTLETLCAYLIYQKNQKILELQKLKSASSQEGNLSQITQELLSQGKIIQQLEKQNSQLKQQQKTFEQKLNNIRQKNSQIENKISEIEQEMQGHTQMEEYTNKYT